VERTECRTDQLVFKSLGTAGDGGVRRWASELGPVGCCCGELVRSVAEPLPRRRGDR